MRTDTDFLSLCEKVRAMISRLSQPLTDLDRQCVWTQESQEQFLHYFRQFLQELDSGQVPIHGSISRAMDFSGIGSGEISELGAEISNLARSVKTVPQ